jgi:UDP-3-O-[3-hydroxymyristoyl] N-acetylglucosamine deacetylase
LIKQRTIKKSVQARGVGIHSGKTVNMKLLPAEPNHGIVFRRMDAGGKEVKALNVFVNELVLSTSLQDGDVKVSTVEHLMSAFSALGIDNIVVELDSFEVPIMDGSSSPFVFLVQAAGIEEQDASKNFIVIKKPIKVKRGDSWAELSPYNGFKISIEIDFDHEKVKESGQKISIDFSNQSYLKEISRARTFGYMRDLEALKAANKALGASPDNAIALTDDDILNEDGLRYSNEFVKHKVLDIVGDLYLLGANVIGHYQGFKTGHFLNNELITTLQAKKDAWAIETFEEENAPVSFYSEDWHNTL